MHDRERTDEAIDLLLKGINRVPADKGLYHIYQLCSQFMHEKKRTDEAITLLLRGIDDVLLLHDLSSIYQLCAQMMYESNRIEQAINLLLIGVDKVPADKNLASMYVLCAKLMEKDEKIDESIELLKQGIERIPTNKNLFSLYQFYVKILIRQGRQGEAIQVLEQSAEKVSNKHLKSLLLKLKKNKIDDILAEDNIDDEMLFVNNSKIGIEKTETSLVHTNEVQETALVHSSSTHTDKTPYMDNTTEIIQEKRDNKTFDVFLCHNSKDKPVVKKIGQQLMSLGILPWLDEWEIRPGKPWQDVLESQINNIGAVAVFVGTDGIGPWQHTEINAFLRKFHREEIPIIPLVLPLCDENPKLPLFLQGFQWVDFRKSEPNPYNQLVWGITGKRPEENIDAALIQQIQTGGFITEITDTIKVELNKIKAEILKNADENKASIIETLNEKEIATLDLLQTAVNSSKEAKQDIQVLVNLVQEMKNQPPKDPKLTTALEKVPIFDDTSFSVENKLKVCLPIIPMILSYEGEYILRDGMNVNQFFKEAMQKIRSKIKPK